MLSSRVKDWVRQVREEGFREGFEKGLEQGIEKGITRGEILALKSQLICRFGPLSHAVEERIEQASQVERETWLDRILEAGSLEEVLGAF